MVCAAQTAEKPAAYIPVMVASAAARPFDVHPEKQQSLSLKCCSLQSFDIWISPALGKDLPSCLCQHDIMLCPQHGLGSNSSAKGVTKSWADGIVV